MACLLLARYHIYKILPRFQILVRYQILFRYWPDTSYFIYWLDTRYTKYLIYQILARYQLYQIPDITDTGHIPDIPDARHTRYWPYTRYTRCQIYQILARYQRVPRLGSTCGLPATGQSCLDCPLCVESYECTAYFCSCYAYSYFSSSSCSCFSFSCSSRSCCVPYITPSKTQQRCSQSHSTGVNLFTIILAKHVKNILITEKQKDAFKLSGQTV